MTQFIKPKIKLLSTKNEGDTHGPLFSSSSSSLAYKVAEKEEEEEEDNQFASIEKVNDYIKEIVQNNVFFMFCELLKKIAHDYEHVGLSYKELEDKYLVYFKKHMKNANLYSMYLSLNLEQMDLDQLIEKNNTSANVHGEGGRVFLPQKKIVIKPRETLGESTSPLLEITSPVLEHSGSSSEPEFVINESKCYARTSSNQQCSRKKQKDSDYCGGHLFRQPNGRVDQPINVEPHNKKRGRPPTIPKDEIVANIEIINGITYIVDGNTQKIYKMRDDSDIIPGEVDIKQLQLVGIKLSDNKIQWYSVADSFLVTESTN